MERLKKEVTISDNYVANEINQTNIDLVRNYISHGCDGPITDFVLICRAMTCVQRLEGNDVTIQQVCANALHEELVSRGYLVEQPIIPADS